MSNYTIQFQPPLKKKEDAKTPYLLDEKLGKAVEVAMALNMPLLLTGEPGTGKTRLAEKIATDLSSSEGSPFLPKPLVFNTKTTSTARELFYQYDALRHFHDANLKSGKNENISPQNYITLQALGKAIALTQPEQIGGPYLKNEAQTPRSSVVLIDEIDKAPRDFPNDILAEIERFQFEIKEVNNQLIKKGQEQQIVLIMTSNSEKNLPEAFLRRVIFYNISFPEPEQLVSIVNAHLEIDDNDPRIPRLEKLVDLFAQIRTEVRKKKPATAELIAWIRILETQDFLKKDIDWNSLKEDSTEWKTLQRSFSILAKTQVDLSALEEMKINI